jgi:uncharacterized membrane protein
VDKYVLLRFAHLIGLMLMSAGLIGVFVADMRSRQVRDVKLLAQAVTFIAVFYDGLVVPGALLLLASGTWLIISYYGGWQFLKTPWLVGMVILFGLEFIEGNTITRLYFMRLRRLARLAATSFRAFTLGVATCDRSPLSYSKKIMAAERRPGSRRRSVTATAPSQANGGCRSPSQDHRHSTGAESVAITVALRRERSSAKIRTV